MSKITTISDGEAGSSVRAKLNTAMASVEVDGSTITGDGNVGTPLQSVSSLQDAYENSVQPEIITNTTEGSFDIRRGSAADADNVFTIQNGAGDTTFSITGEGTLLAANRTLTAIPRSTSGTFSLLDDASHAPRGFSSVSTPDGFTIRVTYDSAATKINSFLVTPDDTLAAYGVVCGGDVGTSFTNISCYAPLGFTVNKASGAHSLTLNTLWSGAVGASLSVSKVDEATVSINHPDIAELQSPSLSLGVSTGGQIPTIFASTSSNITIRMKANAQGYVAYGGATWSQALSDNISAPTLTWQAGTSSIRVDHGISDVTNCVPTVTGHGGVYLPQVINVGSTFFDVAFYDYSGTLITTEDVDMKFWYSRSVLVPHKWQDGDVVFVRRGYCPLPNAQIDNISGNNLWISADMDYT